MLGEGESSVKTQEAEVDSAGELRRSLVGEEVTTEMGCVGDSEERACAMKS